MTQPDNYQTLIEGLTQFTTRAALYRSQFYATQGNAIEAVINRIWQQSPANVVPRLCSFLRAVQWNIERGRQLDAIIDLFTTHPLLKFADLILLNEVDIGMNRTENRNIAFELGTQLGMYVAFVAEYLELTKGIGMEALLPGENREALHGNALLSRYPLKTVRALRLPSCFDAYQFHEKRYGDRVALIAELDCLDSTLLVVSTHLEVRRTPACRATQFRALLDNIAPTYTLNTQLPILIGGDLNTGTFKRGRRWHAVAGLLRLISNDANIVRQTLCHPEQTEPLFALAQSRGFRFKGLNDALPTCTTLLSGLDETDYLPAQLRKWILSRLASYNNQLEFRLDYFCARDLQPLEDDQCIDHQTGVTSRSAHTLRGLCWQGKPISDHDPIVCDFVLPTT
ncbi:MAG: endonuclease/exonuclease/phosphatase family protein [Acidobacteriota bacterium]